MNTQKLFSLIAAIMIVGVMGTCGYAQQDQAPGQTAKVSKEVAGEVSGIGNSMIAIVYNRDAEKGTEEEILLPLDEVGQVIHKNNIKEIKAGDTVNIQYDETTEETDNGPRTVRKAKVITFVKSAPAEAETIEPLEQ